MSDAGVSRMRFVRFSRFSRFTRVTRVTRIRPPCRAACGC